MAHRSSNDSGSVEAKVIVGILNETLSSQQLANEEYYGFTFERTRTGYRKAGYDNFKPHGGSGYFDFNGNSHIYQMLPGKVHSGLTRVIVGVECNWAR